MFSALSPPASGLAWWEGFPFGKNGTTRDGGAFQQSRRRPVYPGCQAVVLTKHSALGRSGTALLWASEVVLPRDAETATTQSVMIIISLYTYVSLSLSLALSLSLSRALARSLPLSFTHSLSLSLLLSSISRGLFMIACMSVSPQCCIAIVHLSPSSSV